jgi:riboflavin kinase / FMN adenylyltransferase
MIVHFGFETVRLSTPTVVCIGTFDGVHRGHQEVISRAVQRARNQQLPAIILTFNRHPAAVLAPDREPPALATLDQNLDRFADLGADVSLVLPFDRALAETTATAFLDRILKGAVHAESVVVGHDFAFGHDREGTVDWLRARMETEVVEPFLEDGTRISSSHIRRAIQVGDLPTANGWLGRTYALSGVVVKGQQLGRTLGYPTANLELSENLVVPADGIYAGEAETPRGTFRAAISIGFRPTVQGTHRTIEAFLLDYPGDSLYGNSIRIGFERKLRDELKFDSLEALTAQMARDVEAARR